ncbi:hypothetical protein SCWH03_31440 [Streptomyces pacificus]|uniref:Uncharacterized protein n=1 Tax=Streptomyces pacificus TaxID=2705029 RepID=A0A6A0AX37_9ACTN|nr:hypothetical protein SCWH03_31440 [Streptomyces pacificus]
MRGRAGAVRTARARPRTEPQALPGGAGTGPWNYAPGRCTHAPAHLRTRLPAGPSARPDSGPHRSAEARPRPGTRTTPHAHGRAAPASTPYPHPYHPATATTTATATATATTATATTTATTAAQGTLPPPLFGRPLPRIRPS